MSILDFAKDIGKKLFDRDDVAAANIKQHLDISLNPINDLSVEYDDGVVTLCGTCGSASHRDQAILLAGNTAGVEKVVASDLLAPAPTPEVPEEKAEFYVIQSGDTLGAIAKKYYGKASAYQKIFEANRQIIDNPDRIFPGQRIRIPLD